MARSEEQNEALRERARNALVDAAFEVFGEKGFDGASVADITERAGVARGLVSYHFGGKEQLIGSVLDRWFATFEALTDVDGPADDRLRGVIDGYLATTAEALPQQRMVIALAMQPSTHRVFAAAEDQNLRATRVFEERLRAIFRERGADDPALEEVMLRSTLEGVVVKLSIYGDTFPLHAARRWVYGVYGLGEPRTTIPRPPDPPETALRAIDAG